jgi:hypothetical protein
MQKLGRDEWPAGLGPNDFKCYGPPSTEDTKFAGTRITDMGCFSQEGVDSNKYVHAAMVTATRDGATVKSGTWCMYSEWGRVGASHPSFQVVVCSSEAECQKVYEAKCAEKNTKRGQWTSVAGKQMYRPIVKKGKPEDLYVVRNLVKRSVGLPDAKTITSLDHVPVPPPSTKAGKVKKTFRCDTNTTKLMRDLLGGAVTYARTNLVGGAIPAQKAIDDARDILQLALKRIVVVGDSVQNQVSDPDLKQLTYALYGSIPKIKAQKVAESTWILSKDNILVWGQDLDAFETALKTDTGSVEVEGDDPMEGFPLDMEWIDPKAPLGMYLMKWWPAATRNRHAMGKMVIKNLWKVSRHGDDADFMKHQSRIIKDINGAYRGDERPLHQDRERFDLTPDQRKLWWDSNTGLVFHGSATVNVPGILRTNLRLPKDLVGVVITGALYGPGNYFADDWKKSAGYTSLSDSHWSAGRGAVKGRDAFMFACEVSMGNPHIASTPHGYTRYPSGTHCIFGKGGLYVQNNEWITFDRRPVLRYLAEFTTG